MFPVKQMIEIAEDGERKISDGYTLDHVLDKLSYYEQVEKYFPYDYKEFSVRIPGRENSGKYGMCAYNYDHFVHLFDFYTMPIEVFYSLIPDVDTRIKNAFKSAGIEIIADLIEPNCRYFSVIDKIKGVGKDRYRKIEVTLRKLKKQIDRGEPLPETNELKCIKDICYRKENNHV